MESESIRELKEQIGNCTYNEILLVGKFLGAPERSMYVNGESAGVITNLFKKGIVQKVMKVGRVWKWRLKEEYASVLPVRRFIKERIYTANHLG